MLGTGPREGAVRVTVNFAEDPAAAAANNLFGCVADLAKHLGRSLGRATSGWTNTQQLLSGLMIWEINSVQPCKRDSLLTLQRRIGRALSPRVLRLDRDSEGEFSWKMTTSDYDLLLVLPVLCNKYPHKSLFSASK